MPGQTLLACFVLACAGALAFGDETPANHPARAEPFFHAREHQTEYAGPGRDEPPPPDVAEVLIGYFGPSDPTHPQAGDLWRAANLAVEEANRSGGYRGKPFRLLSGWSENPWGTGVREVVRMVYTDKVWAVVGGIDGPSTHLAEQVAAKARVTLVSPASTDKTVNLANVPWMFSLAPGDHLQAPVVAQAIADNAGHDRLVLISADDHDSHLFAVELQKCLTAQGIVPRYHFQCKRTATDHAGLVNHVIQSSPSGVAVVAGADQSARLVSAIREAGFTGTIFGGPAMGRQAFRQQAGAAADGVLFPLLCDLESIRKPRRSMGPRPVTRSSDRLSDEGNDPFPTTFKIRFGHLPDYAAANTYDAVQLLVDAVHTAGLNRARIRDAVANRSPWSGAAGTIQWDPLGSNTRPVRLGTIHNGRLTPVDDKPAREERTSSDRSLVSLHSSSPDRFVRTWGPATVLWQAALGQCLQCLCVGHGRRGHVGKCCRRGRAAEGRDDRARYVARDRLHRNAQRSQCDGRTGRYGDRCRVSRRQPRFSAQPRSR